VRDVIVSTARTKRERESLSGMSVPVKNSLGLLLRSPGTLCGHQSLDFREMHSKLSSLSLFARDRKRLEMGEHQQDKDDADDEDVEKAMPNQTN
jgi:hypothetical protein